VRGLLLEVLRRANGPVRHTALELVWSEPVQRQRALDGLVADGLVEPVEPGAPTESGDFRLPGG
jgi:A/G-specific adenine glycosylase